MTVQDWRTAVEHAQLLLTVPGRAVSAADRRRLTLLPLKGESSWKPLMSAARDSCHGTKGKLTGQKPPLKLREIWAICIRLQLAGKTRDLALFNLAIDSKLRACDLTRLRVSDICVGASRGGRQSYSRRRSGGTVRDQRADTYEHRGVDAGRGAFARRLSAPSRIHDSPHLSTRQYARLVHRWIGAIGLDDAA
jgi:hypothetical protein